MEEENKNNTENKEKVEEYTIKVGKLFREVLNKQREKIKEATYGCVNSSDREASEILAKKIIAKKLI